MIQSEPKSVSVAKFTVVQQIGELLGVPAEHVLHLLRKSCDWGPEVTDADIIAMLAICATYKLNPLNKEIFLIKNPKNGKIMQYISVDGFAKVAHNSGRFDGVSFSYVTSPEGLPEQCTCNLFVKGMAQPIVVTELYAECFREKSDPWAKMPFRQMRHKAFRQAVRLAFGISVPDEEEAREVIDVTPRELPKEETVGLKGLRNRMMPVAQPEPSPQDQEAPPEPNAEAAVPADILFQDFALPEATGGKIKQFWAILGRLMPEDSKETREAFEKWLLLKRGGLKSIKDASFSALHQLNRELEGTTSGASVLREFRESIK